MVHVHVHFILAAALAATAVADGQTVACVTGATGFLGQELVAQLLEKGYAVRGTVRSATGKNAKRLTDMAESLFKGRSLTLIEADLLGGEAGFAPCVAGADVLFHTASPFKSTGIDDPQRQLIAPAVEGTEAATKAAIASGSVKKIVLTSSIAATMGGFGDKDGCFDETDWNWSSEAKIHDVAMDAYRYSKLAAERAFWRLVAGADGVEGAAVLPAFIVGPPRTDRTDGESLGNMVAALSGATPPRGDTPMVDVRDVAAAHVAAYETPGAAGTSPPEKYRYLASTPTAYRRDDLLSLLADAYPDAAIAPRAAPPPSTAERARDKVVFCSKNLGNLAGVSVRAAPDALLDMAHVMLELGSVAVTPRAKAPPGTRFVKKQARRLRNLFKKEL